MAELRTPHYTPVPRALLHNHTGAPAGIEWSLPGDETTDDLPVHNGCIELHGAAYIAFCKPWSPLFVAPEEFDDEV
jgi:hypothetical protein